MQTYAGPHCVFAKTQPLVLRSTVVRQIFNAFDHAALIQLPSRATGRSVWTQPPFRIASLSRLRGCRPLNTKEEPPSRRITSASWKRLPLADSYILPSILSHLMGCTIAPGTAAPRSLAQCRHTSSGACEAGFPRATAGCVFDAERLPRCHPPQGLCLQTPPALLVFLLAQPSSGRLGVLHRCSPESMSGAFGDAAHATSLSSSASNRGSSSLLQLLHVFRRGRTSCQDQWIPATDIFSLPANIGGLLALRRPAPAPCSRRIDPVLS